jgi:hypothetical protein
MPSASLRDLVQEVYELGARGALFRAGWELRERVGLMGVSSHVALEDSQCAVTGPWTSRLPFADPHAVADAMRGLIPASDLDRLAATAHAAGQGGILCFSRWTAHFGDPIDWQLNPRTGRRWDSRTPWKPAVSGAEEAGDVKMTWELGRFPHAYHMARAGAFAPADAPRLAAAIASQMRAFVEANPCGRGVHAGSGQEVAIRLRAWLFALDVLLVRQPGAAEISALARAAVLEGSRLIAAGIDFARIAVNNNHLLSEALALYSAGALLPECPDAQKWGELGRQILDSEAERQFYADGGYIQQSHNYHRVALTDLLCAGAFARSKGDRASTSWTKAMERSLDFLVAHQNAPNGWLPNYGGNDGSMPGIFSTCDFADFRPVLQTVSLAVRRERIFDRGPWDEMPAWFFGPAILDEPLRAPKRVSVAFKTVGYHVLRGSQQETFAAFRCGSLLDRFSQIDMLHTDVWWRGQNVLVDGGSYQYNAAPKWHQHFMRTASHNTVVVDGRDQMTHYRQFKVLFWTKARLTRSEDQGDWAVCGGEHYGYRRHSGGCVHHREVLFVKDDLWIVADRVTGTGSHAVRLQWLGGDFEWTAAAGANGFEMQTVVGPFTVSAFHADGRPFAGDVIAGDEETPRGWLSRYYGEKMPVPSFVATHTGDVPIVMVSVLSGAPYELAVDGRRWSLTTPELAASFDLSSGTFESIAVKR